MDSSTVCRLMEEGVRPSYPHALIDSIPVADGGEGSVDAFLTALGGEKICLKVKGPLFEEVQAFYGLIESGRTAVIEMAAAAGLPLVGDRKDPLVTTTFGVGQLIMDAAGRGVKKIILGLGGSATNDGGCGAAAAVGIRFLDDQGQTFIPVGGSLSKIQQIDMKGKSPALDGIELVAMCDIDNPMHGPQGAAWIFAPQKGADPEGVEHLDAGLLDLDRRIQADLGLQVASIPGAGAAGAMGAGAYAFFSASLEAGIEVVLDAVGFEDRARDADLILTGEGRIDSQSLGGKVVVGVARRAKPLGVPVLALVGDIGDQVEALYDQGLAGIFSINRLAIDFSKARERSQSDLVLTVDNLMRFIRRMEEGPDQVL